MGKIQTAEYEDFLKEGRLAYQRAGAAFNKKPWFAKGGWQTDISYYENPRD